MTQIFTDSFDSFSAFVDKADTGKRFWGETSHHVTESSWSGTKSWGDAIALARCGWPQGAKLLTESTAKAVKQIQHMSPSIGYDVAGFMPDVPRYIAGAPDCMLQAGDTLKATRPVVRFLLSRNGDGSVRSGQIINRGAALLAHIDNLESRGISCELTICMSNRRGYQQQHLVTFCVKRAGEPLELDRIAFALANAALFRRFGFCLMEQHKELSSWAGSYGGPMEFPAAQIEAGVIYIPTPYSGQSEWATVPAAVEHMGKIIAKETGIETELTLAA